MLDFESFRHNCIIELGITGATMRIWVSKPFPHASFLIRNLAPSRFAASLEDAKPGFVWKRARTLPEAGYGTKDPQPEGKIEP
jgi:hypothetical protein